jgi:hypothetical protein
MYSSGGPVIKLKEDENTRRKKRIRLKEYTKDESLVKQGNIKEGRAESS